MPTQADRSEATRRRLLDAAKELFAERGFAGTATEEIVDRAGVTRGALYHQFADKTDLFLAVVEEVEADLMDRIVGSLAAVDGPWQQLVAGCEAFLDASLDPVVQRIVVLDAPSVLEWGKWRELQAKYGLGLVRAGLQEAMDAGAIKRAPVEPLAHMLLAALSQGACMLSSAPQTRKARHEVGDAVHALLDGMREPAPHGRPRSTERGTRSPTRRALAAKGRRAR